MAQNDKKRKLEDTNQFDEITDSKDSEPSPKKQKLNDGKQISKDLEYVYLVHFEHRVDQNYGQYGLHTGTLYEDKRLIGTFAKLEDANVCARDYWNKNCLEEEPLEELSEDEKSKFKGAEQAVLPEKGQLFEYTRNILKMEDGYAVYECSEGEEAQVFAVFVTKEKIQ